MNGNGHQMMLELNSDQIIAFVDNWLRKNTLDGAPDASAAMPPAAIQTFSTEHLGSKAFYYAGGEYVEAKAAFHGDRAGEKIHARRDVHGCMGAEGNPPAVPHRALPR